MTRSTGNKTDVPEVRRTIRKITAIIKNQPLATSLYKSIASAQNLSNIHISGGNSVWDIFKRSLDTAIRDIEQHPRGKLFRRLIEYGPHHPDEPEALTSDNETILSDPECGKCVEFIFSHMVNRFKGEMAELLSIEPCLELVNRLQDDCLLPKSVDLYLGDMVQERRRKNAILGESETKWENFTKGADGLVVEKIETKNGNVHSELNLRGVIEVKSMSISKKKVLVQINSHISRLAGGVKLAGMIWPSNTLSFSNMLCIIVIPSTWKLSREWYSVNTGKGRKIVLAQPSELRMETCIEKLDTNFWKIRLAWSQESLNQAAYEMTFWYMSQVGKHVYTRKTLPGDWEYMTPEEAGYNAIKMMLYYMPLRYINERQKRLAIKLYNVYSFGYPLGIDSRDMLWPEDFAHNKK